MAKVQVRVKAVSEATNQPDVYMMLLQEVEGKRLLPVLIGKAEAQSIIVAMEHIGMTRPLPHDLIITLAAECRAKLSYVHIYRKDFQLFYSYLVFNQDERRIVIDARTSDAIAIAVRTSAPIYVEEEIIGAVTFLDMTKRGKSAPLDTLSDDELQRRMTKAAEREDYELASKYRDELRRRAAPPENADSGECAEK
ncbi:MAG: bifunctional nuclease family protein [bacterium]|uniref:Bifunctional nuclease family protein n=1 Tax=Candidatus Aphodosoma intestinipullorum TaxID=2840674 RepID=A0A940DHN2_9BACT|nr:bifunctional nuclease family protein [Candidatus Aphodosoma intestinipullorum]